MWIFNLTKRYIYLQFLLSFITFVIKFIYESREQEYNR